MLRTSSYYHIYNRANGSENLFREDRNCNYFLDKWKLYINPIATTYAWCLMPNHFHFLVKIKEEEEVLQLLVDKQTPQKLAASTTEEETSQKFATQRADEQTSRKFTSQRAGQTFGKFKDDTEISNLLSKQFSRLFSSYAQSYNKVYKRKGSLFIPNFKYKEITDENYLRQVVLYIHNNPVHHGFTKKMDEWKYSSYHSFLKEPSTTTNIITNLFDNSDNFIHSHENYSASKSDTLSNELE